MADTTPIYNLKAVIIETGLSPSILRAWERRYGLIKPQRSPGGHRLYSRQDIELLKWLTARQKEGLSISSAVEMWKSQVNVSNNETSTVLPVSINNDAGNIMLEQLRDQWVTACLAFDDQSANQVLDQAFAISPPETVCIELFQKGLSQIGQGWYDGSVSVQQEHFASGIATRRLDVLLKAASSPLRPQTILVACPPEEEHDFILLLVTYLLRRHGWNAIYLGSNVPIENLDATIATTKPSLVISAAQTLLGAATLNEMSQYLLSQEIRLGFGGGIFVQVPSAITHISGYYLGTNLAALPGIIEVLIIAPPTMPEAESTSSQYLELLESFTRNESLILAQVDSVMRKTSIETRHVDLATKYFTQLIRSALKLGDLQLLDPDINWLDGLLNSHGISVIISRRFYAAYQQAIEDYLGDESGPFLEWFQTIT